MTPTSIRTGRQFDSTLRSFTVNDAVAIQIAAGDANRVGLVVALDAGAVPILAAFGLSVGPLLSGTVVPLTCITTGHPVCYLSVDKIGSAIFAPLYVFQESGSNLTIGVTTIRQVQELP